MSFTPILKEDIILKTDDVSSLNMQYESLKKQCDSLASEFDDLPVVNSVDDYNFVHTRLKELNKQYNTQVEMRKQISRILDLGKDRLMEPENLVAAQLKKWRGELERFQKEEKKRADEKLRIQKEQQKLLEEINEGVRSCQLALEGYVLERRKAFVKNIEVLLPLALSEKTTRVFTDFIIEGAHAKVAALTDPIIARMSERTREEVKSRMQRDAEYGTGSFLFKLESEAEDIFQGCVGNESVWSEYFSKAEQEGELENIVQALTPAFKKLYPEFQTSFEKKKEVIDTKAHTSNMRAAINTLAVGQTDLLKGTQEKTVVTINNRKELMIALDYYLDRTGEEGLNKIVSSLGFVLNLINKEKPPLLGLRYQEKQGVTLR